MRHGLAAKNEDLQPRLWVRSMTQDTRWNESKDRSYIEKKSLGSQIWDTKIKLYTFLIYCIELTF